MNHIDGARIRTPELTYSGEGVDVDRDGDQDLFISNHTHGGSLWRNLGGGRFTEMAKDAWPRFNRESKLIDRHHCTWADVDGNSRPDAYCTTGRTNANYVKRGRGNELWIQQRVGGHLADRSARWRVSDVCGRGRVAEFVNANGDEFPDLVTSNARPRTHVEHDECDTSPALPNEKSKLFINIDGDFFHYAPLKLPLEAGMGASYIVTLDYDSDGWQDLYLCRQSDERPLLFKNQQGHGYVDVTAQHQLAGRVSDAAMIDLDLDNDPDLVTASTRAFQYQLNEGGVFSAPVDIGVVPTGGDGWAVAVGDIDGDGERDVYGMIGDRELRSNPNDVIFFRHGLTFTRSPVPRAGGLADDVVIVKPWLNGQVGLLVLNGYDKCCGRNAHERGPLALFRWGS